MAKKTKIASEQKEGKEIKWIFGGLALLALVFVGSYLISNFWHEATIIKYKGFVFDKQPLGSTVMYHTSYPVTRSDGKEFTYNMYFKNDPRQNNIPIVGDDYNLILKRTIFLGFDKNEDCGETILAIHSLSEFLTYNNFFLEIKSGVTDNETAKLQNMTFINGCEQSIFNTVVILTPGNETKVTKNDDCYTISYANCDVVKAAERFMLKMLEDGAERSF